MEQLPHYLSPLHFRWRAAAAAATAAVPKPNCRCGTAGTLKAVVEK